MKRVDIYTDGACSDNGHDGIGGWACVVTNGTVIKKEISGGELHTTNNIMELKAVINAIKFFSTSTIIPAECMLRIFSDSSYVVNGINQRWVKKWIANGWKTSKNKPVQNKDLWIELNDLDKKIDFQIIWTKGHADDELNIRADKLAKEEVAKLKNSVKEEVK